MPFPLWPRRPALRFFYLLLHPCSTMPKQPKPKSKKAKTTGKQIKTTVKGSSKPTTKKSTESAQVVTSKEAPKEDSSISIAYTCFVFHGPRLWASDTTYMRTKLDWRQPRDFFHFNQQDRRQLRDLCWSFPPKGANRSTSKGGGKKKTEHNLILYDHTFKNHPKYWPSYALAKTKAQKTAYCLKVKNQLKQYVYFILAFSVASDDFLYSACAISLMSWRTRWVRQALVSSGMTKLRNPCRMILSGHGVSAVRVLL